ncbi:hypothetical protein MTR_5g019795 [Medicago truncatula]|uniref:Uncharacterized protein n=1 Tax=Medicago truncatula TaxID=3880 RepID=G7ZW32_MEDTR|nr:hypothetical protein MTR_5g019795 [Medicago truncatula]
MEQNGAEHNGGEWNGFLGESKREPRAEHCCAFLLQFLRYTQVGPLHMHKNSGEGFGPGVLVAQQR